jgi:hypothetical protein
MGAMPRLKIKDELHYRKGSANESENCLHCEQYISEKGNPLVSEPRCRLIGVQLTARYRVRPDFKCDKQKMSFAYQMELERLRNGY